MTRKYDWQIDRKHWTRPQQKTRIMALMTEAYRKGDFRGLTARTISVRLEQLSADYIRGICDEMVKEGSLIFREETHRHLKGGEVVMKKLYYLSDVGEMQSMYAERKAEEMFQKRLF